MPLIRQFAVEEAAVRAKQIVITGIIALAVVLGVRVYEQRKAG